MALQACSENTHAGRLPQEIVWFEAAQSCGLKMFFKTLGTAGPICSGRVGESTSGTPCFSEVTAQSTGSDKLGDLSVGMPIPSG